MNRIGYWTRPFGAIGVTALLIVASATLVLLGWRFEIAWMMSLVPGEVAMNPATAVGFMLAAAAVWLLSKPNLGHLWRRLGAGCAASVLLLGVVSCSRFLAGWDAHLDQILFAARLEDNRMAPNTAIAFVLVGVALWCLNSDGWRSRLAEWLLLIVAALSLMVVTGYAYGAVPLSGIAALIPMALNTAILFGLLALAVLVGRPQGRLFATLRSPYAGGQVARRLLPVAMLTPFVLGWLRLLGERADLYSRGFGVALMVSLTIILLAAAIHHAARILNASDLARQQATAAIERVAKEREEAEKVVRQLNRELDQRVRDRVADLARANRELQQKNQENEMFVYSVSHDLRSPLVNLQGFSKELAAATEDLREIVAHNAVAPDVRDRVLALVDEDIGESIHFIQTSVMRLSNIIDALLRLSRAGRVEYQCKSVDVQEVMTRVVESVAGSVFERGADVLVHDLPPALGDAAAIEQVFANLVTNALKYLAPARPGKIEIGCTGNQEAAGEDGESTVRWNTYYVRDNGVGIPKSSCGTIFQASKRAHPDLAPVDGMGLAIVRCAVERHGGQIWVESTVDAGSTFYVRLPSYDPTEATSTRTPIEGTRNDAERSVGYLAGGR